MNLRSTAAVDAKTLNIKDWGLPVELTDPDGEQYLTDNESGETLKAVQILFDRRKLDLGTGEETIIKEPVIVMARKSLARIPQADEVWFVRFPEDVTKPTELSNYFLSGARAPEGGQSLDFIRLYPQKGIQEVEEE